MKDVSEEGRMLRFTNVKWRDLLPEGEDLIAFLLEKDLPVYFRVDPVYHLVYRRYRYELAPLGEVERVRVENFVRAKGGERTNVPDVAQLPVNGFLDCDFAFLRLDRSSLEQIDISRSCPTPRFTRGGLVAKPAYRVIGSDSRGRPIREVKEPKGRRELVGVEFDEAVVIDKNAWNFRSGDGGCLTRPDPLDYILQGELKAEDLFLDAIAVDQLREQKQDQVNWVPYPFEHKESMPAIYLMFQAAHHFRGSASTAEGQRKRKDWLKAQGMRIFGKEIFNEANLRTAEKFARENVNRSRGGARRGEFNLRDIKKWKVGGREWKVDISDYEFPSVGVNLSVILAMADLWVARKYAQQDELILEFAKTMISSGFGGHEVGHLVNFITGEGVTLKQNEEIQKWLTEDLHKGRRNVVDTGK